METWDVYDIHRNKIGKMQRNDPFSEDAYTCVLHVLIFNSKGEMLIQQRQSFKKGWPNLWDITVGGHTEAGETSQQSASRELFEELGIKRDFTGVRPHFTINFPHGFDDFYFVEEDIDLDSLILQPEEVQAAKWASRDEIKRMIVDGEFIEYYPSLIDFMFDSRKNYGAHCDEPSVFLR
ncbi:MAG: NUDIX domain-containing protein [Lachnospiraceae bacterium]|nr:NUDIX domain-containing protein [Lachnospiraceae bacterium]